MTINQSQVYEKVVSKAHYICLLMETQTQLLLWKIQSSPRKESSHPPLGVHAQEQNQHV